MSRHIRLDTLAPVQPSTLLLWGIAGSTAVGHMSAVEKLRHALGARGGAR